MIIHVSAKYCSECHTFIPWKAVSRFPSAGTKNETAAVRPRKSVFGPCRTPRRYSTTDLPIHTASAVRKASEANQTIHGPSGREGPGRKAREANQPIHGRSGRKDPMKPLMSVVRMTNVPLAMRHAASGYRQV